MMVGKYEIVIKYVIKYVNSVNGGKMCKWCKGQESVCEKVGKRQLVLGVGKYVISVKGGKILQLM